MTAAHIYLQQRQKLGRNLCRENDVPCSRPEETRDSATPALEALVPLLLLFAVSGRYFQPINKKERP
jgi:hypothetical protein